VPKVNRHYSYHPLNQGYTGKLYKIGSKCIFKTVVLNSGRKHNVHTRIFGAISIPVWLRRTARMQITGESRGNLFTFDVTFSKCQICKYRVDPTNTSAAPTATIKSR
jgi:hypothetical protein